MGSGTTSAMRREYWTETTECSRNDSVRVRNDDGGLFGACFGGVGAGARARDAPSPACTASAPRFAARCAAVPEGVERDLDRSHREHRLADTGRGAVAGNARGNAMDASAAVRGGSAADALAAAAKAATDDGGNNRFGSGARHRRDVSASRLEKTEKEKHSPAFSICAICARASATRFSTPRVFPRWTKPTANSRRRISCVARRRAGSGFRRAPGVGRRRVVSSTKLRGIAEPRADRRRVSAGPGRRDVPEGEARALARRAERSWRDAHEPRSGWRGGLRRRGEGPERSRRRRHRVAQIHGK